jgi:hypothetical protein
MNLKHNIFKGLGTQGQQQWQATLLHPFMSVFHHFAGMMEAKKVPFFFLSLLQGQLNEFQLKFPFFFFLTKAQSID